MNKKIIGILIVLLISIFVYYKFFKHNYTTLFSDKILLDNDYSKFVSNLYLPSSITGNKFTYTFWIFLKNIPENSDNLKTSYTNNKFIFSRNNSPGVYYNIKHNMLKIKMNYKDSNNKIHTQTHEINIRNLKLQKWTHLALVLNNRELYIYINGNLHKTSIIPSVPFIYNKILLIGEKNNNFNGYLFDGRYYNKTLDKSKITNIFNESKSVM